ncbi:MAG: NAD-dependent epimerase/dehydratase family protein [Sphingomonadaceae bacterium]|nr:NAD-dependent epimerase/dehydratase family protein [Sphingomonadaceae bacterium]
MSGTVLVTGGSGYIAGFLIRQLIEQGWTVHTTIRSLAKEAALRATLAVDDAKLRVFAADLTHDKGWADAVAGCSHVAHLASPLPVRAPKHEDELIVPAREGALRALRFARDAGVTRFVMTSSAAAIAYGRPRGTYTFTEADWTNLDHKDCYPYIKSKTIAERAARGWVAAEGGGIEYCAINPSLVLGPVMSPDFSASVTVIRRMLEGRMPGLPDIGFGVVDVRDVADLHARALTAPNMAGERFIASGPFLKLIDVARILKQRLGPEAAKVRARRLPDWLVRLMARFDPSIRQVTGELGKIRNMDASHAKEVLGWEARPPDESIVASARSLIDLRVVKV